MSIVRIWKESKGSKASWTVWDRGDEIWELKGDTLRHFEVLERSSVNNVITERLRLLRESAIPLEAIRHSVQGWQVDESVAEPQVRPVLPLTSSPLSPQVPSPRTNVASAPLNVLSEQGPRKKASGKGDTQASGKGDTQASGKGDKKGTHGIRGRQGTAPLSPFEEISLHETPSQTSEGTLEEESSQTFYTHPMELWSSLSQWIPQHALFQPSLHHQATLELSDTPAQTYPYQIDSSENSQPAQGQYQHVRQVQSSKPYRPRPSFRTIEIPKRPLFV
jgi:hypothetical protein